MGKLNIFAYFTDSMYSYDTYDIENSEILRSKGNGYWLCKHTYEIPKWIAEVYQIIDKNNNISIVTPISNINYFISYIKYELSVNKLVPEIYMSVLDCNYSMIKTIVESLPNVTFHIGGYKKLNIAPNIVYYNSVKQFARLNKLSYKQGYTNYELFTGTACIPRLTMSYGCKHNCKFCAIEHNLVEVSKESIFQQVDSFKVLEFQYVYIDDKTFGQANTAKLLPDIYNNIIHYNKNFKGFIIQTTAIQYLQLSDEIKSKVAITEIGVESYNDDILQQYNKPHRTSNIKTIFDEASPKSLIANIIVGLDGETEQTISNTLNFLTTYSDKLFSINTANYSNYGSSLSFGEIICEQKSHLNDYFKQELLNLQKYL